MLPSGRQSHVARIIGDSRDVEAAVAGQSVTLTLADEVDVSRGRRARGAGRAACRRGPVRGDHHLDARPPMLQGRSYLLKIGTQTVGGDRGAAEVQRQRQHAGARRRQEARAQRYRRVRHSSSPARSSSSRTRENRDLGGFILIDRITNTTVGAGLLHFALRRSRQRALAGARRQQARARGTEGTEAVRHLVHGSVRRRQVDDRQPAREAAARARAATPICSTATTCAMA